MVWFEGGTSRVYYEDEGSGELVLVLPGWGGTIEEFVSLRAALKGRYRVIAADLPGSGRSDPQPRLYNDTYYEDDARTFLTMLAELGTGPAHLVGFSDGGEYALIMAELRPDLVRSVLTVGAAGVLVEPAPGMLDAFASLVDDPIEPLREFSEYLRSAYGAENARLMAHSFAAAVKARIAGGGDLSRARAGAIRSPVLMISGEQDMLAPPELAAETAKAIPGARFVSVPGAEHQLHLSHPAWFVATVTAWLQEVATSHGHASLQAR